MRIVESFNEFQNHIKNNQLQFKSQNFNDFFENFSFFLIETENGDQDHKGQKRKMQNEGEIIVIDEYKSMEQEYLVICFTKSLYIVNTNNHEIIKSFLDDNQNSEIYIISAKFDGCFRNINIKTNLASKLNVINETFNEEINNFICSYQFKMISSDIQKNESLSKFWKIIKRCFCAYLIKNSYQNSRINRVTKYENYFSSELDEFEIHRNEYIELRELHTTSTSTIKLIYQIKKQMLFVLKIQKDEEKEKLFEREHSNYLKVHHPFLLKLYGSLKNDSYKGIVLDYIEGMTLNSINKLKLDIKTKLKIVFQLIIVLEYIHYNHFIYRDLKPNNIIIDKYQNIVLIDLDRMIQNTDEMIDDNSTIFFHNFIAPEIAEGKRYSYSSDIYSLGLVMYYIIFEKEFHNHDYDDKLKTKGFPKEYSKLFDLIKLCLKINPNERPNINALIHFFHNEIIPIISEQKILINRNEQIKENPRDEYLKYLIFVSDYFNPYSLFKLASIYEEGIIVKSDINMIIHYYSQSAELNDVDAQFNLGLIFQNGIRIKRDMNKAIHYYSLAAKQNDIIAQKRLGDIFYKQDIRKAIYYYTLAANQNDSVAQFNLGCIYLNGESVSCDIKKSIQFFTASANNNNAKAQFNLGKIYTEGIKIARDMEKGINYLKLAAKQNHLMSQYALGKLYLEGIFIPKDINNAIYYFKLAADQNLAEAQSSLGHIYSSTEHKCQDIKKGIYYLEKACNKDHPRALFNLFVVYYKKEYKHQNIKKSIFYLQKAVYHKYPDAQYNYGMMLFKGENIRQDKSKAIYYLQLAASQNKTEAKYALGQIYYHRINNQNDKNNINKAMNNLYMASKNNFSDAQFLLAVIYSQGKYISLNIAQAIHYYKEASNLRNKYAKNNLAIIYSFGFGVDKNISYAIELLKEAVNLNDKVAMYNLAFIYYIEDIEKNKIDKIIELLIKSYPTVSASKILLSLALMKKYPNKITLQLIENEIRHYIDEKHSNKLACFVYNIIQNTIKRSIGLDYFNNYHKGYMYDDIDRMILTENFISNNNKKEKFKPQYLEDINNDFYEGFYS